MNKIEKQHLQDIFYRFSNNWDASEELKVIERFLDKHTWIKLEALSGTVLNKDSELFKLFHSGSGQVKLTQGAVSKIARLIKEVKKEQYSSYSAIGENKICVVWPLREDDKVFGFVVLVVHSSRVSNNVQLLISAFLKSLIKKSSIELELEELNETIRPRAVALSTVHTVHRLMSSTLNMNELLPRIARLTLQVMRANRCSIKLVDKKQKILLPKTTIDLRKTKAKLKKVQIGKYAPGKAVKYCRSIMGKNFLATPLIEGDVLGVITVYDKIDNSTFTADDMEIMKTMAEQAVTAIRNAQLYQEQENLTIGSIKCLAMLLQTRSQGVHKAQTSFFRLFSYIGNRFNMNETEVKFMQYASMLHDTGQISIPEKVLMKKSGLTGKEFDIIKTHTSKGADILSKSKTLKPIVPIILFHHEKYNGTGYPKGLKGEEIPLPARVMAVVSAFEAMVMDKPYRRALSIDKAIDELEKNAGTQFDPKIVEALCEIIKKKNVHQLLKKELTQ
ncbi:MAG: HD domain-containing protein [Candidatus Omnitrophica bacterium]|nr:HD domain-containing protein [Candidatus Omnitrophota bacterium]